MNMQHSAIAKARGYVAYVCQALICKKTLCVNNYEALICKSPYL